MASSHPNSGRRSDNGRTWAQGGNHAQDDRVADGRGGAAPPARRMPSPSSPARPASCAGRPSSRPSGTPRSRPSTAPPTVKRGDNVQPLPKADSARLDAADLEPCRQELDGRRLHEGLQRLRPDGREGRQGPARALRPRPQARGPLDLLLGRQVGHLDPGRRRHPGRQDQVDRRSGHGLHPRAQGLGLRRRHRPPAPDHELGREVERGLHRPQLRRRPRRRQHPWSPASTRS